MELNEIERRKKILHTHFENPTLSFRKLAKMMNLSRSTVTGVIRRFQREQTVDRLPVTREKPGSHNKKLVSNIVRSLKANPGLSDIDRAQRYGTSTSTGRRVRLRAGYKSYRIIKHPNRSDKQNLVAKKRARLLYSEVLTKFEGCILMDDESYVKLDLKQNAGLSFYASKIRGNVSPRYKYQMLDKYGKKVLVWQGICSCGLKTPAYMTTLNMNSQLYMKECLEKRVLPFIRSHRGPVKFWPDLASCHYSKATMSWYENNEVDVIAKNLNPPNCPELRPIERYWALVKRNLKKTGGVCSSLSVFQAKWRKSSEKVDREGVQRLMAVIKRNTRNFIRNIN